MKHIKHGMILTSSFCIIFISLIFLFLNYRKNKNLLILVKRKNHTQKKELKVEEESKVKDKLKVEEAEEPKATEEKVIEREVIEEKTIPKRTVDNRFFKKNYYPVFPCRKTKYNPKKQKPVNTKSFFKANFFFNTTLEYGTTKEAFNKKQNKVSFLDQYGTHNMNIFAKNSLTNKTIAISKDDPLNLYNIVQLLNALEGINNFGTLSFQGKLTEASLSTNIKYIINNYWFIFFKTSLKTIKVDSITFTDLTPENGNLGFNQLESRWTNFITEFDAILDLFDLDKKPYKKTSLTDSEIYLGLDFQNLLHTSFNLSPSIGLSLPTGKKRNEDKIFSLPYGYNGYTGLITQVLINTDPLNNLSIQGSIKHIFFMNTTKAFRMKTNIFESDLLKAGKGIATKQLGSIFELNILAHSFFCKKKLHFQVGYQYNKQEQTLLTPKDLTLFSEEIVNTDKTLAPHNLHRIILNCFFQKRNFNVGFFYKYSIKGRLEPSLNTYGANGGIQITYSF